jgi:DNA-binding GntR family transcriptional regulator
VSRAPVRDALHRLEEIGVAERRPPRGLYLRSWTKADHEEVLALVDAFNLLAVQLSFGKLTDEDFAKLERIVAEARQSIATGAGEDRKQIQRDADFHLIIARAAGNRRLVELMERLMLPCVLYVSEAHDYLERDFWVNIHGSLLHEMRGADLEKAEARSMSNARAIREIMFKHNARGPLESISSASSSQASASQLAGEDESEFEPPLTPRDSSVEREVGALQLARAPDPIQS